ncbi:flavin-containing monooxygenase [Lederbergia citrea]|uniref:flavin-containing monooxygenase n=1 Tax=Lederbergia citrea TaxID=2833581 RepID=UPI001BC8D126|nr:NAD(P)/FAD-dependent oxidoreductase [Lederbergia citrea]MBS4203686.1 NAD(P)/FAD-dependent oxidoreductase [Lederbergia citrea]
MKNQFDCIVIGGGQAGLASGYYLQKESITYLILEAEEQAVGSWPKYYDSLTLFSPARYSSLPGLQISGDSDRYPSKDEVISYLSQYAEHFGLNIRTKQKVVDIQKKGDSFVINTADGNVYFSKSIISATGAFSNPRIPQIEGSELFKGKIFHSSQYKNGEEFKKQRVIVVGAGNSAIQIAYELAKVSNLTLATRKPINYAPQRILGKDLHFWLKVTGVDTLPFGKKFALSSSVLDTGIYKEAILNNMPERKDMFIRFTEEGIIWKDGTNEKVDSVIYATGYLLNVSYLTSLNGAEELNSTPLHKRGISITTPGLYFVGISGQRSFSSATIRGGGRDAKYVVKHIKEHII